MGRYSFSREERLVAQLERCPDYGVVEVNRPVRITRPLNLRNRRGIRFRTVGRGQLLCDFDSNEAPRWPVIDTVGSVYSQLGPLLFGSVPRSVEPGALILLGRRVADESSAQNTLWRIEADGVPVRGAYIINAAAELTTLKDCILRNPIYGHGCLFSGYNSRGMVSPHGDIAGHLAIEDGGPISCVANRIVNCNFAQDGSECSLVFEPHSGLTEVAGNWFSNKGSALAPIWLDNRLGNMFYHYFQFNYAEHGENDEAVDLQVSDRYGFVADWGVKAGIDPMLDTLQERNPAFRRGVRYLPRRYRGVSRDRRQRADAMLASKQRRESGA